MLGGGSGIVPPLDLSALLQFVVTALVIACGLLVLLRNAASKYFVVDAGFEPGSHGYEEAREQAMSIGRDDGGEGAPGGGASAKCFVCGNAGSKTCSRCKNVRYCSLDCQSKHWKEDHKLKCRKKESGSAVSLLPERGACKVLKQPKAILFPYDEFVKLYYWDKKVFPPCGLLNCGNSCFANVVLQCLSCTRPLTAYLLEGSHSRECRRNDWCFLCELQSHIQRASQSSQPFSPMNILSRLPNIGSHLGYGKQEDAHEFMRFAIDTMQSICLDEFGGEKAMDPSTQETSLIQHIFGGHLQSQVICTRCNMISNRYENMMDLTVEIQGDAESLEDCLDQFTAKEWLDGDNMYKCNGCNDYVKAWKRLTVHQDPNILTIALKRFQTGRFGKLNKRVSFPETLDLGPYMSGVGDGNDLYTLYAVVVHLDMLNASFFGHYICFTKDFCGNWYRIDDCKVMKVEVEEVLSQGAYMLLYSRLHVRQPKHLEVAKEKMPQPAQVDLISSGISESMSSMEITNERKPSIKSDTDAKNEEQNDMDVNEPVASILDKRYQDPRDMENNVTERSSLGSKELEEGIFSPRVSSFSKSEIMENQESHQKSDGVCEVMGKKGSTSKSDGELEVTQTVHKMNHVPSVDSTCSLSSAKEYSEATPSLSSCIVGSNSDQTVTVSIPASSNRNSRVADSAPSGNQKAITSVPASRARPLFSAGFLDKRSRKKPILQVKGVQAEGKVIDLSTKSGGYCNGLSLVESPTTNGRSESHSSPNSHKHMIKAYLNGESIGQTANGGLGLPYMDDSTCCEYSESKNDQQTKYDLDPCQKPSSEKKDNSIDYGMPFISRGFLSNHSGKSEEDFEVAPNYLPDNGLPTKASLAVELSMSKESEQALQNHGSCQELACEDGEGDSLDSVGLLTSNCFLTKPSGELQTLNEISQRNMHGACTSGASSHSLEISGPKESDSIQLSFLDNDELQGAVHGNGTNRSSDVNVPFLSRGFLDKPPRKSKGNSNIGLKDGLVRESRRDSGELAWQRSSESAQQNSVPLPELYCGNGKDNPPDIDNPFIPCSSHSKHERQPEINNADGKTGMPEDGCSHITKCNRYSDHILHNWSGFKDCAESTCLNGEKQA